MKPRKSDFHTLYMTLNGKVIYPEKNPFGRVKAFERLEKITGVNREEAEKDLRSMGVYKP